MSVWARLAWEDWAFSSGVKLLTLHTQFSGFLILSGPVLSASGGWPSTSQQQQAKGGSPYSSDSKGGWGLQSQVVKGGAQEGAPAIGLLTSALGLGRHLQTAVREVEPWETVVMANDKVRVSSHMARGTGIIHHMRPATPRCPRLLETIRNPSRSSLPRA